jgi:voltage-dependent calcium channel T type alpha-1G
MNKEHNFDNLGNALMSLFILISKDGWIDIMYSGIDAVGIDKQPIENYNEWMIIYFISFLLFVGFFLFNTFIGVIIENFIRCRDLQKIEENKRTFANRFKKFIKASLGNFYYIIIKFKCLRI